MIPQTATIFPGDHTAEDSNGHSGIRRRPWLRRTLVFHIPVLVSMMACSDASDEAAEAAYAQGEFEEAFRIFLDSCDAGSAMNCERAIEVLPESSIGAGSVEAAEARAVFSRGCEAGMDAACRGAGFAYGAQEDPQAYEFFEAGCELGDAESCFWVGLGHETGESGQAPNAERGREFQERACRAGYTDACGQLAMKLIQGTQQPRDVAGARELLGVWCSFESGPGCFNLGLSYLEGSDPSAEYELARKAFDRSCDLGSLNGCVQLGAMLVDGQGGPQDGSGARAVWQKACDQGAAGACYNLSFAYARGIGGSEDREKAEALMAAACRGGYGDACELVPGGR